MLHCVEKPTTQPLRSFPSATVTTTRGGSSGPVSCSRSSAVSSSAVTSRSYPAPRIPTRRGSDAHQRFLGHRGDESARTVPHLPGGEPPTVVGGDRLLLDEQPVVDP